MDKFGQLGTDRKRRLKGEEINRKSDNEGKEDEVKRTELTEQ